MFDKNWQFNLREVGGGGGGVGGGEREPTCLISNACKYISSNCKLLLAHWIRFSADGILKYSSHKFQEKVWHFMQNVYNGDNLHEMLNPFFL